MRLIGVGTALSSLTALLVLVGGEAPAAAATTDVWTEPASTSVFRESTPSADSGRSVTLDVARNEYETAQVVLRRPEAFVIQAVNPSTLTGPAGTIAASNVTYNFVDYQYLERNTYDSRTGKTDIYPTTRTAPGHFPDRLTNERGKAVAARSTQSIWTRFFIPAGIPAGKYSGSISVVTDKGTVAVPVSLQVHAVTLPESKEGAFTTSLWHVFFGNISWDDEAGETVELPGVGYGYPRYSPQWWDMLGKVAKMFKEYRTNNLQLPVIKLLADAGSLPDGAGGYRFDWTRFDQIVELMMSTGAVKRLEGFPEPAFTRGHNGGDDAVRDIQVIRNTAGKPTLTWVNWSSAEGQNWMQKYLPALRAHLEQKGWADIFWTHAGDEPQPHDYPDYVQLAQRMHEIWPGIKLGDAVDRGGVQQHIMDLNHQAVVLESQYDKEAAYYDQIGASGKEIWLYNCTAPRGNYLNRFIDQPQWYQRMTIWYAYSRGMKGYLHWALNNWQIPPPEVRDAQGDRYMVRPDTVNNSIEVSPRYESLRDGIEDWELLNLLGKRDKDLSTGLAKSLVQRADKFSPDTSYLRRIRALALKAAAGEQISPDLARGASTTASAGDGSLAVDGVAGTSWQPGTGNQWLRVDLGRQVQLDGVNLRWNAPGVGYKLQISYDGNRWTEVSGTATSDGATDFVGINGKGRYVRVETSSGTPALAEFQVAGFVLGKPNLAGGRSYRVLPAPDNQTDSGIESTDGVLADAWDDGRSYGYLSAGEVTVTMDLGSVQAVDSAAVHAYEEYPAYRPDGVRIATSVDGVTYTQRGNQLAPRGPSGVWYSFEFPAVQARHVQVTFTKKYGGDASAMYLDEIEVYAASGDLNLAGGRPYAKTRPAPPEPAYPDSGDKESTDGSAGSGFGVGYGYHLPTAGERRTVDVTVDLGQSTAVRQVRARKYDDGVHDYAPSTVRVFAGDDLVNLTPLGQTSTAGGAWFTLPVTATARYVRLQFEKARTHDFADYLFIDEVEVLNAAGANLAVNRPYRRTHPATPHPNYPDVDGRESTDSVIAAGFEDGHSYGYHLPASAPALTVDLTIDLGAERPIRTVKVRGFDDGIHAYSPDDVTVLTSDDPFAPQPRAETSSPNDQWFTLQFPPVTSRYVTIRLEKARAHDFADHLFVDEVIVN